MKSLRRQLLASHLLLGSILLAVMIASVARLFHLGHSIDRILRDNYASVIAAENMKETLERQDSAATFYLAGQVGKARRQYQENRPLFEKWCDVEAHNITEVGEQELSDGLVRGYPVYRSEVERLLYANPPMAGDQARRYYFGTLEPHFLQLKSLAQGVLDVNQRAIVRADNRAETEARVASWTALGATLGAIALGLLLANGSVRAILAPLGALARQAEEIGAGRLEHRINVDRPVEIASVAVSFNRMAERLLEARRVEEQRLHRAERMSDVALESLYDPVLITDASSSILHINRAAEGLFGKSADIERKPLRDVVNIEEIAFAIDQVVSRGAPYTADTDSALIPFPSGKGERFYRLRAAPMRDDDESLLGAVAVLEDVTHLREVDRLKTEFISVASHELRTPVTSLLLSVELLQEGAAGRLTKKQSALVEAQREDLDRLQRLMRDLLDVTRLEAGASPPRFERVAIGDVVDAATKGIAPLAAGKGVSLCFDKGDETLILRADIGQMNRVLANLLDNALRHTEAGGSIRVRIRSQDGKALISVSDTGSGILKEYLPRIFERFAQVPGATRGGSGLGLSIARAIVEAHGGTIQVDSELNKGSVFTVALPAEARNASVEAAEPAHS